MYIFIEIALVLIFLQKIISIKSEKSPFGFCLQQQPSPGLISCAGRQALSSLQFFEDADNFTLTSGLTVIKGDTQLSRSLPSFIDQDPMDFRGILENAGAVISQRTLQWDLTRIYPGLQMRIGPSYGSTGVLEFVMDSNNDRDDRSYLSEEPSTARILTKQFILPFLLGLKFNLVTLLPLLIAAIIFVLKKGAFLAKIALFLSGLFGFGSIFSLGSLAGLGNHHKPDYGLGHYGGHHNYDHLTSGYYKSFNKDQQSETSEKPHAHAITDSFYDYEKKLLLRDRASKLFERDLDDDRNERTAQSSENRNSYRNFAWKTQK